MDVDTDRHEDDLLRPPNDDTTLIALHPDPNINPNINHHNDGDGDGDSDSDSDSDDDDAAVEDSPATVASGSTLLHPFAARIVTTTTKTAQTGIVYSAFAGYYVLKAGRLTTMASLGLGRALIERLLASAGHSAAADSPTAYSRAEAEYLLGWTFQKFHQAATAAQLVAATLFDLTGDSISAVAGTSLFTLNLINNLLGSTESSKAVAAIIALVHREIQNPTTGADGEQVGYVDLVLGLCGLAYLQRCCRKLSAEEDERLQIDETVWDVVVVKGQTVAVRERRNRHAGSYEYTEGRGHRRQPSRLYRGLEAAAPADAGDHGTALGHSMLQTPEEQLRREIAQSLPAAAKVTVSTSTTRTVTIELNSARPSDFAPPPGMVIVEESKVLAPGGPSKTAKAGSTYRTVYRMTRSETRSTEQQQQQRAAAADSDQPARVGDADRRLFELGPAYNAESAPVSDAEAMDVDDVEAPPVPPKHPPTLALPRPATTAIPNTPPRASKTVATQTTPRSAQNTPKASQLPVLQQTTGNAANQKRARQNPTSPPSSKPGDRPQRSSAVEKKRSSADLKKDPAPRPRTLEKRPSFRSVLRKGTGPTISNLLQKQGHTSAKQRPQVQDRSSSTTTRSSQRSSTGDSHIPVPDRKSSLVPARDAPPPPSRPKGLFAFNRRSSFDATDDEEYEHGWPRSPSRSRVMDDQRSIISTTDAFSVHSLEDTRPSSPQLTRDLPRATVSPTKKAISSPHLGREQQPSTATSGALAVHPRSRHERAASQDYAPSIYTLKTNDSRMSLALSVLNSPPLPCHGTAAATSSSSSRTSFYADADSLSSLKQTGAVPGLFPQAHLVHNISRYMRFSSAVYGSHFLRLMGISTYLPDHDRSDQGQRSGGGGIHGEIQTYAHHTGLDASSVLVSSFVDPGGGSDVAGETGTNVPLVHCISVDTEARAVVLACRGTLGFEDVLADMTCVYDLLAYRGRAYSVHKGFHASARRLADRGGRVVAALRAALLRHPGFGLVLTGHSLGGAVTALLGVMIAEPNPGAESSSSSSSSSFVTAPHSGLPPGRACHVYAYGPPATMSPALRRATRRLITSVVHGADVVPSLSLGAVHDVRAVCLAFRRDNGDAKAEVRARLWRVFERTLAGRWTGAGGGGGGGGDDDDDDDDVGWCFAALKTLRASMMNVKLVPPGEVLVVESAPASRKPKEKEAEEGEGDFVAAGEEVTGGTARRVVCRWVRDVEARFGEMRICASMLTDHNPSRYEEALEGLRLGLGV
ncbi:uncharacterized protein E0L32_010729 [Thyridium curvatum]|uniref:sn-1-specific diacylglycerol lipase n=1 Tax=Thyridium curvatum TaxID=1093900 RepID=A0A507ATT9_9PEZI|nr:uncharacterized protein E0L32_010729 [Thyridium curvatum]TPX07630.1 hypothetical protein E0L32_010729 [Thyridium curvatum]